MNDAVVALVERLGIALLHSLWQGSLVGLVLLLSLLALRRARSQVRYLVCCLALLVTLILPIATFLAASTDGGASGQLGGDAAVNRLTFVTTAAAALEAAVSLLPEATPAEPPVSDGAVADNPRENPAGRDNRQVIAPVAKPWLSARAEHLLTGLVAAWSIGVTILSCRLLGGYVAACRLTRRFVQPLDEAWQTRVRRLARKLGVRRAIELWQSACVEAPVVIGCFRPVILVPVEMLTGLTAAEAEAILAHELAHICRYDFLVNAVQCVIETLLFYHPCVWWIGARIRAEREHCCDEFAVAACGDSLVFAKALAGLEELRPPARLAVALTSGNLIGRIRRLLGQPRASDIIGGWITGMLAIAIPMIVGGTWAWGRAASAKPALIDSAALRNVSDDRPTTADVTRPNDIVSNDTVGSPRMGGPLTEDEIATAPRVDFLVPARPGTMSPADFPLRRMMEEYGPELSVQVVVMGLPGDVYGYVYEHLRQILPNVAYFGSGNGDIATVHLVPISDLDYFASKIELGEIASIDREKRVITIVADHNRLPQPQRNAADDSPPAAQDQNPADLASLCQRLGEGELSVVGDLIAFGSAAESAVTPFVEHEDRRARRAALLVLKRIATAESLPPLLVALKDVELGNRDLAWQAICQVPEFNRRQEVVQAAAAALVRQPEQAAKWLTVIGRAAEPVVLPYTRHDDSRVRLHAVGVLKEVGTRDSLPALERLADDAFEPLANAANAAREAILRRQR